MTDDLPTIPAAFGQVRGRCPACGYASLFLGAGGYVTCGSLSCPRPDAASVLLEDSGAERDAALATVARVRELAAELDRECEAHRLDSDPLWMLAGLANADRLRAALVGPAGAGSTQDGA